MFEDEYFKFNMNMPAVITVDKENLGSLHLGTVSGTIDGDIVMMTVYGTSAELLFHDRKSIFGNQ